MSERIVKRIKQRNTLLNYYKERLNPPLGISLTPFPFPSPPLRDFFFFLIQFQPGLHFAHVSCQSSRFNRPPQILEKKNILLRKIVAIGGDG